MSGLGEVARRGGPLQTCAGVNVILSISMGVLVWDLRWASEVGAESPLLLFGSLVGLGGVHVRPLSVDVALKMLPQKRSRKNTRRVPFFSLTMLGWKYVEV